MAENSMTISFPQKSHSSDSDSRTANLPTNSSLQRDLNPPSATVAKRPRGRPLGSKNKPKLRSLSLQVASSMGPSHIMVNVAPGRDIMESILDVARQRHVNLTILSASGIIASVTLRNSHDGATTITLNGPFTLLSMNGSLSFNHQYSPSSFSIELSTSQGQLFGGPIGGNIIASDNVRVLLCSYKNFEIYKFTPQVEEDNNNNNNNYKNHHSDFNGGSNLSGFNMVSVGQDGK